MVSPTLILFLPKNKNTNRILFLIYFPIIFMQELLRCIRLVWFLYFVSLWWLSRRWYNFFMSVIVVSAVTLLIISIRDDLSKIERETMRGLLSQRIDKDKLKPGDHIYTWRKWYTYAHHGIYGRDGNVIHLTRREGHKFGANRVLFPIGRILFSIQAKILISLTSGDTSSSHLKDNPMNPCSTCGYQSNQGGVCVTSSCMECFLSGGDLYLFHYNVSVAFFLAKLKGGTCTRAPSDPPEKVLGRAERLLSIQIRNGFDVYDLFLNNCEDFTIYCKTGPRVCHKIFHPDMYKAGHVRRTMRVNSSGQARSLLVVVVAAAFALSSQNSGFRGVFIGFLIYCMGRLLNDAGKRIEMDKQILDQASEPEVASQPEAAPIVFVFGPG